MKTAVVILLAAAGFVAAQDLGTLPKCAQECIAAALPQVGCALTDAECQCKDETKAKLAPLVTPCLTSKCTTAELQQALAASEKLCAPFATTAVTPTPSATESEPPATETEPPESSEPPETESVEPTGTGAVGTTSIFTTPTKTAAATSAVVTAGAAQFPVVAGAGLLAVLIGAVAGL